MNLAYDLFLLTFNLSQLHDREKIIQLFVEGMGEIFKPVKFNYSKNKPEDPASFKIRTGKSFFGVISTNIVQSDTDVHRVLISNSVQMLSIILEHLEFEQKLEKERDSFEKISITKLREIEINLKELQESRSASINLIEDLTDEIEKRKSAEVNLKETQLVLKATLESPVDMIILAIDKNFNYLSFNNNHKAVMKSAYDTDIKLGMNLLECMVGEEDIKNARENYSRAMNGESLVTVQEYGETERSYYESFYNPIRNENNDIVGATVFARNISERKKAELALKESEEKFRNLFEHSPVGKSMTGIDGTLHVNKSFCKILGYSEEELMAKNWKDISHPDDIPKTNDIVKSLIEGKSESARFEKRYLHKNGKIIFTDITTYLQRDNSGKPQFFITTVSDITERIRLERERFRLLDVIDKSSNEIYIFDSESLIFEYVNRGALVNIGYSIEEMRVMTPVDIKPFISEEGFREMIKPLLSFEKQVLVFETFHRRKNGTDYPVEVFLQIYNDEGKKLLFAIINDITTRRVAEQEIQESEEKYRTLIEVSMDAIFINNNNKINYINRAGLILFGAEKPEQIVGKSPYDIFHPDYHNIIRERINDMLTLNTPASLIEEKIIRLDGTVVDVEVAATPFMFRNEMQIQIILRDISERKRTEAEIKELNEDLEKKVLQRTYQLDSANKELEAFSYSVSHDLRAPLRAVHSYTRILTEDYKNVLDDEGKRICEIIESSATHMGQLIDDLLSFSRIGRSEINTSKIDMTKIVNTVLNEITSSDDRIHINIKVDKLPSAYCDPAAMKQVIINLISNAIKYSSKKEESLISVGCKQITGVQTYFVKDNGVGFDMKYSNKLFGVFQRLHSTKEFEGNGVGLAIVQRIIHRHGGKVWAEGEVGKGATFFFTLPDKDKRQK